MNSSSRRPYPFAVNLYSLAVGSLLILAMVVPKGHDVLWINGRNNVFLDFFFGLITNLGDGLVFIPVILVLLFVRFYYSVLALIIWISSGLLCSIIKRGVFSYMRRPKELLDNHLLHFVPNIDVHSHYSFPSGHAATIFCATFFLSLLIRNRIVTVVLLVVALTVSYSRIYLLQHFLMDVAGGSLIGLVVVLLFWKLSDHTTLGTGMNNAIRFGQRRQQLKYLQNP